MCWKALSFLREILQGQVANKIEFSKRNFISGPFR